MNTMNGVTFSAAGAAFDQLAGSYDQSFTHTAIGWAQRKQVWRKLAAVFLPGSRILELNCGTGEDARFLARRGRSVVACDASSQMIAVARRRGPGEREFANLEFLHIANEELDTVPGEGQFDGAFSNFSGLNCVADLRGVAENLARLVRPGGRVLLCIWGRVCVTEMLWYLLHGEKQKAFRRFAREANARVGGMNIRVYYHSVHDVRGSFSPWFQLQSRTAIGVFVPPSFVEGAIGKHEKVLAGLGWLDRLCGDWPVLRDAGDHMLLELARVNNDSVVNRRTPSTFRIYSTQVKTP